MVNGSAKTMAQIYEMQDIVVTPRGQTTAAPPSSRFHGYTHPPVTPSYYTPLSMYIEKREGVYREGCKGMVIACGSIHKPRVGPASSFFMISLGSTQKKFYLCSRFFINTK